jgi:predicted DNA-binding protein (MmcQ/YjbR family)
VVAKGSPKPKGRKPKSTKPGRSAIEELLAFCRSLPGATEDVKWGNDLVFSVGGKMFAGFNLPAGEPFGFKVDPLIFSALTSKDGIEPAPYAARFHWVSVATSTTLPLTTVKDLLFESHALVAAKLSGKLRRQLRIAG